MRVHFLLGPSGSGKTSRCLAAIRDELVRSPDGPPLLLLAPKQATFQLERRLLEYPDLPGWTRLQILSFDRLARQILEEASPVELLDEDGRIMVLRALLRRHQTAFRVFHASARLAGFAQEVSATLRELQRHRAHPQRLTEASHHLASHPTLSAKLHDLALLLRHYLDWLREHQLTDADSLPDLATEALRDPATRFQLDGLWLDGFAEMTPQEIELLAAVASRSRAGTLAFCLDHLPVEDAPWRSVWAVVSQTFRRLHNRFHAEPGCEVRIETLARAPGRGRFAGQPDLFHLEEAWTTGVPSTQPVSGIRLVQCRDLEHESEVAAREIWRAVRGGARFRDIAVILRSLDDEAATVQRVFTRYAIPFFLDRRTPLAHHPLAELTRSALRLAAHGWLNEDWFAALKTGLTPAPPDFVDRLENEALAHGWNGEFWSRLDRNPPVQLPGSAPILERLLPPLRRFIRTLGTEPLATQVANAIRRLWDDLGTHQRLDDWTDGETSPNGAAGAFLHHAAREKIEHWLTSVERGFAHERIPLPDWLAILETGLASLTAGVIPPAQDQVLIGAIDRSRQPELRLAIVLGLNEGRFPAPPPSGGLFTDRERDQLGAQGMDLTPERLRVIGQERYFGYIAFTRACQRLVLCWSERARNSQPLNVSPFVRHVQRLFPLARVEDGRSEDVPAAASPAELAERLVHPVELLPWLLRRSEPTDFDRLLDDDPRRFRLDRLRRHAEPDRLLPATVAAVFGGQPEVSVSALESLAACPFQFFVRHTLRGRERDCYEPDPRQVGSLAHELLARFLLETQQDGIPWRDLTTTEAIARLDRLAAACLREFAEGLFAASPEARWRAEALVTRLRDLVAILVRWARSSEFDPSFAEIAFGGRGPLPAWRLEIQPGQSLRVRGKVDRVDVCRTNPQSTEYLVIDYKLRSPRLDDELIAAGIDLQLPAYTLALQETAGWLTAPSPASPSPAGMCYVGIGGRPERPAMRPSTDETTPATEPDPTATALPVHRGRFRADSAARLDRGTPQDPSGQFAFRWNRDGSPRRGSDARPGGEFDALLAAAREAVHRLGTALWNGDTRVSPYREGSFHACQACDLLAVCRFDAWTQPTRRQPLGTEGDT